MDEFAEISPHAYRLLSLTDKQIEFYTMLQHALNRRGFVLVW